jgi:phospholipid/cholesterol/gamma-HCH transport system substrate-binding protein
MKKYALETVVGIFVLIGVAALGYMTVKLGHLSVLGPPTYPLYAPFTTVSGMRPGSPVQMLGLSVGTVEGITLDQDKGRVVVEMQIRQGVRVYDDAIASIRTDGLLGDKYLSIDPGGAGSLLKPGGTITETQPAVDLVDLIGRYAFGNVEQKNSNEVTK